jgi:hypothetical protein
MQQHVGLSDTDCLQDVNGRMLASGANDIENGLNINTAVKMQNGNNPPRAGGDDDLIATGIACCCCYYCHLYCVWLFVS